MLPTSDGRVLDHVVVGDGPLVISLHGTPSGHRLRPLTAAAAEVGRLPPAEGGCSSGSP